LESHSKEYTKNNSIVENIVSNCTVGMRVYNAFDNEIFRNNFINNKNEIICEWNCDNIWDDNNLGNYWDDYTGVDNDGDGIGDKPKNIIGENNSDHFPLMVPYGPNTSVTIATPREGYLYLRNFRLMSYSPTIVLGNIKIEASAANYMNNTIKINKVEFYVDGRLRWVDKTAPYSWRWRISSPFRHYHTVSVVVYDSLGNTACDKQELWRFF
jgi:parallel beta-helix repeat protein